MLDETNCPFNNGGKCESDCFSIEKINCYYRKIMSEKNFAELSLPIIFSIGLVVGSFIGVMIAILTPKG